MSNLDRILIGIVTVGLVLVGIGLFRGILFPPQAQITYLKSGLNSEAGSDSGVYVDIEGAVMSPGVYLLKDDARLKDLLVAAGGLSEIADREYCEKNLNMAQRVTDGQKIYIPKRADTPTVPGYIEAKTNQNLININTADIKVLDTLWGVGEARAESIVKNRPYQSLEELVLKGALTKSILEKNRDKISLF